MWTSQKKPQFPRPRGFTLVEMLVVIALIAVLAALLTPVALKMSREAKRSACLGQLRSLGVSLETYLGDHLGVMPTMEMGRTSESEEAPVLETILRDYVSTPEAFHCPGDEEHFAATGSSYFWNNTQSGLRRHQLNMMGTRDRPEIVPLIFDKEAFHPSPKGVNFLYADQSASREQKFSTGQQ